MMNDKRRYVSKNPSPNRDRRYTASEASGNPARDGYSLIYRAPLDRPAYPKDSLHRESYNCDGLLTEDEARMEKLFGPMPDDY